MDPNDDPKVEEPKAEELKIEEPKVEDPKTEDPKVVDPKTEEPGLKVETPKGQVAQPGRDANSYYNEYDIRGNKFGDLIFTSLPEGFSAQQNQQEETKPLIDLTSELPSAGFDAGFIEPALIDECCEALKTSRLLLISCADKQIATSSAYAVVDAMGRVHASLQRRCLDFERIARGNVQPSVFLLRTANDPNGEDSQKNGEVVIVVDTIGRHQDSKAQQFLNSLMGTSFPVLSLDLKQKQVSLLCLVDVESIQARMQMTIDGETYEDTLSCPHREIPFLGALLRQHFPETYERVQEKIEQQRGRWGTNNKRFWIEIKELIKRKQLLSLLETPYAANEVNIDMLFKDDDIEQDVRMVVLFVAVFCPNLNAREFHRVVMLLLGDRTRTVTVNTTRINDKGIVETVDVKEERSLLEVWQQRSDKIKEECHLHSVPDTEITRVIDFKDDRLRPLLKQQLEQEHAFFTSTHIERLFSAGLLFDPSPRISDSLVKVTAAAAASDPDYYGTELLLETITKFEQAFEKDEAAAISTLAPLQLLSDLGKSEASLRLYSRLSNLLRILLDQYKLHAAAQSLLEQLVRRNFYESVFKVVVGLRFTQGFDQYHWLKQLFERGDLDIKTLTFGYLYRSLKGMGTKVYSVLTGLDGWLPKYEHKKDQTPTQQKSPTASGNYALVLLMAYCLETTRDLKASEYGAWPSSHPLFVFPDVDTANSNLSLLARLLFHPWMNDAFPKEEDEEEAADIQDLISDLIFHWILILFGPPRDEDERQRIEKPSTGPNAITVNQIFIQKVVANASEEQRQHMLARWQGASELMLFIIKNSPYGDELREEMVWQRSLLDDLISQFKDYSEAAESSRAA
jgi:hypothetical protein